MSARPLALDAQQHQQPHDLHRLRPAQAGQQHGTQADQLARTIATHRAAEVEARVKLQTAIEALGLEQLAAP